MGIRDLVADIDSVIFDVLADTGHIEGRAEPVLGMFSAPWKQPQIGRALVNKPAILLCDEPTGNLDPANSNEIMKILNQVNKQGTTVLVVTHNMEIVQQMKKRTITMSEGKIISDQEKGGYFYED